MLGRAQVSVDRGVGRIPPGKRKPILIVSTVALTALLLAFAGAALVDGRVDTARLPPAPAGDFPGQWGLIPAEELFLPREPDFVPGVLLGREQRTEWTVDDAEPWWQNPLAAGEEQWRIRIESIVDEIMESVP